MKKSILLFCLSALLLTGCSEKDKAYYLSHIDNAKSKLKQCEKQMFEAMSSKDKEKFEAIRKDKECIAADQAIRENRKIQIEKARLEKEALEKSEISKARKKLNEKFAKLDWKEIAYQYVNSDCAKKLFISSNDYLCRAFKALYDEKAEQGKTALLKNSLEQLFELKKTYCAKDQRRYSTCDIWKSAVKEQSATEFSKLDFEQLDRQKNKYCEYGSKYYDACSTLQDVAREKENIVIEQYVKNYDALKKVYNQCIAKITELAKIDNSFGFYSKRNAILENYPCSQARSARSKLGLPYDNFKTLMD
ncbi:hypothetical protein QJU23_09930 [Pasteurella atlantica]|uniref:Uncharacterized protein n=2 Tax=Pasteurellaceae TaxID=712 RepID=A0ACC6HPL7_9PAST|nr:hypothetical protein [Pasteurella atlantica]MDP8052729.1 hypothetical protein [Pasteurella atlantica]MDP8106030.1 hypothetical protein [Pasteurella atlantica]MDP8149418.1 hypothetical protein [Pasteurella atlantica]